MYPVFRDAMHLIFMGVSIGLLVIGWTRLLYEPKTYVLEDGGLVGLESFPWACRNLQQALSDGSHVVVSTPWGETMRVRAVLCGSERPTR